MEVKEKIWNCPYADGLFDLVVYYSGKPDPEGMILKFQSIRSVIEGFYQVLVNKKEMDPIESLSKEEKRKIWKLTKGCDERIKASRAIYLMQKIIKP